MERERVAAALLVAEEELRAAQVRGDRVALARWRLELAALELRAQAMIQAWSPDSGHAR